MKRYTAIQKFRFIRTCLCHSWPIGRTPWDIEELCNDLRDHLSLPSFPRWGVAL